MGVDFEYGWKVKYEILFGKEKVIDELCCLVKDVDIVYFVIDLDCEGEVIVWYLWEVIGGDESCYKCVVFNEIIKKVIQEVFFQFGEFDINWVNVQQVWCFFDCVVGYMVLLLFWQKIVCGLFVGCVQLVVVKLVVECECEICVFVLEEYWEVYVDFGIVKGVNVCFEVICEKGEVFKLFNEVQVMVVLEKFKVLVYSVVKCEDWLIFS